LIFAIQARNKKVVTIEGVGTAENLHPIQRAFMKWNASQCGYCIPAMILAAKDLLDKNPEYKGKTLHDVLFRNGNVNKFPTSETSKEYENDEAEAFGFYIQKGLFEEYAEFGRGHGHDLAPFDEYHNSRGLRWPVVNGKETRWRYREGFDPSNESAPAAAQRPILSWPFTRPT